MSEVGEQVTEFTPISTPDTAKGGWKQNCYQEHYSAKRKEGITIDPRPEIAVQKNGGAKGGDDKDSKGTPDPEERGSRDEVKEMDAETSI